MSIEEVVKELEGLTPEQLEQVADVIRGFSQRGRSAILSHASVPASVVDHAVSHGWPAELFSDLIGSLPELERAPQPPIEKRPDL